MIEKQELCDLYLSGLTIQQIATMKNHGYGYVQKLLKNYNIVTRKSGVVKGTKFSKKHKLNISKSIKGMNHPNFGKKGKICGKRYWFKCSDGRTISMRSRWEILYANYLNKHNIKWKYEPITFKLKDLSAYTPDFYLTESNQYIEIKGWMTETALKKIENFKKKYPNKKLLVLQKKDLENLGIDLLEDCKNAELPKYKCQQCKQINIIKDKSQRFCSIKCRNKWVANNRNKLKTKPKKQKRNYKGKQYGEHNNSCKLTEKMVLQIRKMREEGYTLKEISIKFNTSVTNVGNIANKRSWRHI